MQYIAVQRQATALPLRKVQWHSAAGSPKTGIPLFTAAPAQKMIELADAYVALPGGPGTLDEISEVICLARLGIENKACVLFDTDGYYQALKKIFEEMVEVGFSEKEDFKRVLVSADLDEIERFIEQ